MCWVFKKGKFHKLGRNVLNTNKCEISICSTRIKNRIVIFSAIDNLIKGASGQAIQNMNLIYKLPIKLALKWEIF